MTFLFSFKKKMWVTDCQKLKVSHSVNSNSNESRNNWSTDECDADVLQGLGWGWWVFLMLMMSSSLLFSVNYAFLPFFFGYQTEVWSHAKSNICMAYQLTDVHVLVHFFSFSLFSCVNLQTRFWWKRNSSTDYYFQTPSFEEFTFIFTSFLLYIIISMSIMHILSLHMSYFV